MPSRKLTDLHPPLKDVAELALIRAARIGLGVIITCTKRTPQEQLALYAQGRESLESVNSKRAACGLYLLSEDENDHEVTCVTKSYHTVEPLAMAFDFAIACNGKISWDVKANYNKNDIPDYKEFAEICKFISPMIQWGGDWEGWKDMPHIQWKNGMV
jgi:peptidoglycan L-alanyl-D-glutamate endopeptidase CwlK